LLLAAFLWGPARPRMLYEMNSEVRVRLKG